MFRASICVLALVVASPLLFASEPITPSVALKMELPKFTYSGTLSGVLDALAVQANLNIQPDWKAIESAGAAKSTKVAIQLPKVTAEQAMEVILSKAGSRDALGWYIDGDNIRVTTLARAIHRDASEATIARPTTAGNARGNAREPARQPASQPANLDLEQGKHATLSFKDTRLEDVMKYFQEATGLNFDVNYKSLELSGITRQTPVTLQAKDLTVARALDLVMDQISGDKDKFERAYWVVDEGVITIATGTALNTELHTRVYDVSDLLVVAPDFQSPRMDFSNVGRDDNGASNGLFDNGAGNNSSRNEPTIGQQRQHVKDELIGAIKDSIGEDMWKPTGKGTIRFMRGQMVISQTLLGYKLLDNARHGAVIKR